MWKEIPMRIFERECPMPTTSLLMLLTAWTLLGPVSIAGSQPSILPQRDGTTSTLTPLGERDAIYSDAHGGKGVTHLGSGIPSHTFSSPMAQCPDQSHHSEHRHSRISSHRRRYCRSNQEIWRLHTLSPPHHPIVQADTAGSAGDRGASRSNDQSGMILPQAHPPKSTVESLQVFR
jgi:hypothetical protein